MDTTTSNGRHQQLSEKVADSVREAIMAGELRPGFLRTEKLASDLGVSPTPVREALMILHAEGALQWEPRRGFRLIPMTAQDIIDLYEVQAFIAGELAARAVTALSPDDLDNLELLQKQLEGAAAAGQAALVEQLNHRIHRAINTSSQSTKMTSLLRQTVRYVPLGFFERIKGWTEASAHDHASIFVALRQGDAAAARSAMKDHIRHIGERLLEHLRDQDLLDIDVEKSAVTDN